MVMNQQDKIARLREHRAALRALGVYEYAGIEETIANSFEGPIERSETRSRAFVAMLNPAEAEGEAHGLISAEAVAASLDAIVAEARRSR